MILRRGCDAGGPAPVRLDGVERNLEHGDTDVLIVLDEADTEILSATLQDR